MSEGTQLNLDKFIANMRADAGLRTWYTRTFLVMSLATTSVSSTPRFENQYTLRPILHLIIGSGYVGLNYSHSTSAYVDVETVEMTKTPHHDGLLNQARG